MPSTYDALSNRISFLVARQGVIAQNIANASTPGYLSQDIVAPKNGQKSSFAMLVTQNGHISGGSSGKSGYQAVEDKQFMQHNGNSVRLDAEMMKMNEISLDYKMLSQIYTKQVALQKTAIGRSQ